MFLALGAAVLIAVLLMFDIIAPLALESLRRARSRWRRAEQLPVTDPGRERRAEQRARELLRSCVNAEEWAMYRELGFIRVWSARRVEETAGEIAYLIYPHRPVISFSPVTGTPMHEYCVLFPDEAGAGGVARLPNSDDVLAKWMALTGDEERFLRGANLHQVGRQVPTAQVRGDLWRLSRWEGSRIRAAESAQIERPSLSGD